ncbi:hypothetical protein B0H17DRAFT_1193581 [Mycena rosella]|uniref:Uncharacterized protein n=1 Tax=Mycena rosella TaxID=1033263 RepID=A0AAD7M775_MYCRO|nr:hypothetical protein B0H17DRAFT_1193581 [Mycena rosella]
MTAADSQNEDDDSDLPAPIAPSRPSGDATAYADRNALVFAKQFARHKRLQPTQISEAETFAADPIATRQIKMYTVMPGIEDRLEAVGTAAANFKASASPNLFFAEEPKAACIGDIDIGISPTRRVQGHGIEGRLEAMRTATADFKASAGLNKNLQRLASGILILVSPQLAAYKGQHSRQNSDGTSSSFVPDILKKRRFGLPVSIEFIAALGIPTVPYNYGYGHTITYRILLVVGPAPA